MHVKMLQSKSHRATGTEADLNYIGSITIDKILIAAVGIRKFQEVEIANINTGGRFTTYVMAGDEGVICLNDAAARSAQPGDLLIIMSYAFLTLEEADHHKPKIIHVDEKNHIV